MVAFTDVKFFLSGGPTGSTPATSLGGSISTTEVGSQTVTGTALTGVAFVFGAGNAEGVGTVTYTHSGTTLSWTPPGDTIGLPVTIAGGGLYTLRGASPTASGYIIVSVTTSWLPTANGTSSLTVATARNTIFDDVSAAEAVTGDAEYRCIFIKNTAGSGSILAGRLWIGTDATGPDTLAIGLDPAGVGASATTIGTESIAPTGVTFTAPLVEASGLVIPAIAFGSYLAVWIRRIVPALSTPASYNDLSTLRYSVTI